MGHPLGLQMIQAEFELVRKKIDAAFNMLHDNDTIRLWYENLKSFDYTDVDTSASEFIYSNNRRPTIADIVTGARASKARRTRPPEIHGKRLVKCPYCNDTGLIVTESPNGGWNGRPCDECGMGRVKHPWEYKTEEEREAILKDEEKQGLRPPRDVYEAPKEFYLMYNYGVEKI